MNLETLNKMHKEYKEHFLKEGIKTVAFILSFVLILVLSIFKGVEWTGFIAGFAIGYFLFDGIKLIKMIVEEHKAFVVGKKLFEMANLLEEPFGGLTRDEEEK